MVLNTWLPTLAGRMWTAMFLQAFFNYLIEGEYTTISIHVQVTYIPDPQLKFIVEKVSGFVSAIIIVDNFP